MTGWVLSIGLLPPTVTDMHVGLIGSSQLSQGLCHLSLCIDPVVTSGGTGPFFPQGGLDPCDSFPCRRRSDRKWIDGWIIGNVDWSPLRLPCLYRSSVSNWSHFLFINIRPLFASLLITLLFGLTLRRGLIE